MTPHEQVTQAIAIAIGTDVDLAAAAIDALRIDADARLAQLREKHKKCRPRLCPLSKLWEEDRAEIVDAVLGAQS